MKKYVCPVCGYVYEGDELLMLHPTVSMEDSIAFRG